MAFLLLEDGSYLLNILGGYIVLEGDILSFNCAELLGLQHTCNFFGEAFNYSNTQNINIRGRVTGSYENITGVWDGMNNLISTTSGNAVEIYVNSVSVGRGFLKSLDFDRGTDVGFKFYSASFEIPLHAGSGMYLNSGYLPATGAFFQSTGTNVIDFFRSSTGKYIKDFSEDFSFDVVSSGKFAYEKNVNFSLDEAILDEFAVSPQNYATSLMAAAQKSYGDINILTAFYPDYYKNASGITYTTQSFDTINYAYSFSERFEFQTGLPYIWSYNHSLQLSDSTVSVDEKGTITSSQLGNTKLSAASTAWSLIETGIYGRVSGIYAAYTGIIGYSGGCGLANQPEQSSVSKNACGGSIEYSKTYSNSPFNSSGYSYAYTDSIELDEEGYVHVSENGQLKAFRNIRPSGFNLVYSGHRARSGEILARISGLYVASTGSLRSCSTTGGFNFESSQTTYQEYDAEVSYELAYTDNPNFQQDQFFYQTQSSFNNELPLHMVNYFPVSYGSILAQRANQSTRGRFTNSIYLVGKENTRLSDFVSGALQRIQKPSGTDIYVSDYGYKYEPLDNVFQMNLTYDYTSYRGPNHFLI